MSLENRREVILGYSKLKHWIDGRKDPKIQEKRALKYIDEIASDFSPSYIGLFKKFLDMMLPRLYDGLHLWENGFDLKEASEDHCIVFVPNHKSHADYIAFYYLFYQKYRTCLNIAGGINLDIPLVGRLFRKSGCFFIRRTFAGNSLYRLSLEAYLYYLLKIGNPIKFFFEGGRTRTGKMLPPKSGFFQLLLEAYREFALESHKSLLFVPVSIVYDRLAEHESLLKELEGAQKERERLGQLLGVSRLISRRLGSISISLGRAVGLEASEDAKEVASRCFREVAANVPVTPVSLLSFVLLDNPVGGFLSQEEILTRCTSIIGYCRSLGIACSPQDWQRNLGRTLSWMVGDGRIGMRSGGLYSVKEAYRAELLYFKYTIIHHFLAPWAVWESLEEPTTEGRLEEFFVTKYRHLGLGFHLPSVDGFLREVLGVFSYCTGSDFGGFGQVDGSDGRIRVKLGVFAKTCRFIDEGRYRSALALRELSALHPGGFDYGSYGQLYKDSRIFRRGGYEESRSLDIARLGLKFFSQDGTISSSGGLYRVERPKALDNLIGFYEKCPWLNDRGRTVERESHG